MKARRPFGALPMATARRNRRILGFMDATRRILLCCVICSGLATVVLGCHSDRRESFYASLADEGKADASAQSWIPDDLLPASSRNIHDAHEASSSTEWCAFEFVPADSPGFRKHLKGVEALPPSVSRVPSPGVSWWPAVLAGHLDASKIRSDGLDLYLVERPATSVTTEIFLFAVDWAKGRGYFYSSSK
jgi:hypothetical protein